MCFLSLTLTIIVIVRLGKSGLKVSKIILGCMSYGSSEWAGWVLDDEQEAFRHIKFAYDHGIQTFDTANVSIVVRCLETYKLKTTISIFRHIRTVNPRFCSARRSRNSNFLGRN